MTSERQENRQRTRPGGTFIFGSAPRRRWPARQSTSSLEVIFSTASRRSDDAEWQQWIVVVRPTAAVWASAAFGGEGITKTRVSCQSLIQVRLQEKAHASI